MTDTDRTDSLWTRLLASYGHMPGIGWVLIVAALLRGGSIMFLRNFLHPVTWEFGEIARNINAGFGYSILLSNGMRAPSAIMPPGYPYLLAFSLRTFGDRPITYLTIEIIQAALGVLLVYVVYRTALILLGERGAIIAAGLTTIYPAQIYMCSEFHSINIYIVLGSAAVFFLVRYLEVSQSWKDAAAAGVCMGILLLFRAEALALVFVYAAVLVLRGGRKAAAPAVAFVLIALACLAPWTARNYRAFGKLVPIASSAGINLWIGNNLRATGGQHYDFVSGITPEMHRALNLVPLDRDFMIASDDVFKRAALEFMRTHPRVELHLALKKLFIFFVFDPLHEKARQPGYWLPSLLLTLLAAWAPFYGERNSSARTCCSAPRYYSPPQWAWLSLCCRGTEWSSILFLSSMHPTPSLTWVTGSGAAPVP
jgi:hypothetical protein